MATNDPSSTGSRSPLAGLRVLDLSRVLAGPFVGRILADLGAEVVKVEPPEGDLTRTFGHEIAGISGYFTQQNAGKRNVCVDLTARGGPELVADLAAAADIVVENFRPGVLARFGLDYAALSARNRRLIMLSISGFGQGGPESQRAAYASVLHAESGLIARQSAFSDQPPTDPAQGFADTYSGLHGLVGLLTALYHRERTGEGQHIDIAMADVMFGLQDQFAQYELSGHRIRPGRNPRHHPMYCPVGTYDLPEGYGYLLVLERQWPNLCRAMDRPDLVHDPRFATGALRAEHQEELVPLVQEWLLSFSDNASVMAHCLTHRVPLGEVFDPTQAVGHPHFEARGMVRRVPDPVLGEVTVAGYPFKFSAQPELPELYAPRLGEHNAEVLQRVLGYDDAMVAELVARGVLQSGSR